MTPRKDREAVHGDTQQLVLAFFPSEDRADEAAMVMRNWDEATEYMKLDSVGVLVMDDKGKLEEHKAGKRARKKGMGIGVDPGVIAASSSTRVRPGRLGWDPRPRLHVRHRQGYS
ncbi:hypothetical protein OHA18_27325 [Kribbella sp. NBC_00709]|uniref:hypothetical protein n=1 Tax=Kribbella sp. NBC_00709 TaxID=2975972 RepID=UPI002E29135C|nr:hypothetical protein [Kribbella sp. NBC_00709]